MKILFLCHKAPFPANDGGTIATLAMIKGFAELGHRVVVLTMQTHKHSFDVINLPDRLKQNIQWHTVWVNTRVNPLKLILNLWGSQKPYNATRFESPEFETHLSKILAEHSFDVIQLEGLYLSPYINIIRQRSTAKVSLRAHNIESEIWKRQADESVGLKKWYYRILSKRINKMEFQALQIIDLLVPITQRDATYLPFKNQQKVHVSPTGIEPERCELNYTNVNSKNVFYIGALDWQPNIQGLQWFVKSVWRQIAPKFPEWSFIIAGRNATQHFSNSLRGEPVTFIGQVNDATLFIDSGNIMVVPLFSGSGMRIKIIEGMARGKCIVTTPIGAEGIAVENGKHLFIANSSIETIEILSRLISNPELVQQTGLNAFEFAKQNFNNQTLVKQLADFYQQQF